MSTRLTRLILALLCAVAGVIPANAQEGPIIRARSRVVTITDGVHLKKDYWFIMPERSPDVYYVEIPRQPHTVTFTTDVDAISFDVTFGSRHPFIIRLADGREARTEIRTEFKQLLSPTRSGRERAGGAPAIPFTLGDNDKIYVKGRLNAGPPLDLQFDLGAGGTIVKKASVTKARLTFDGTITLRNSDGENAVPSSSRNDLEIAGLRWSGAPIAVADNMTHREDGLIGNALFQDKVLEIDYDRMLVVVHDELPPLSGEWKRQDMFLDGGVVPFVRGVLSVGDSTRDGWFMLDTGAYTSILNSDRLSPASKLAGEMRALFRVLDDDPHGPVLAVAGRTFSGTNYGVRRYDGDASALGLLGNDVLKRFNLIVDNRGGAAYFRPNANATASFRNPERRLAHGLVLSVVVIAGAAAWWVRRRRTVPAIQP